MLERLQKVLAHRGVASRRAAETLIEAGRVRVNGEVVRELGVKVDPEADRIEVDGRPVEAPEAEPMVLLLNKPAGYVTTVKDRHAEHTVMELIEVPGRRLYPVGRLDQDTRGVLLFTDDGELAHRLTHPSHQVEKIYQVRTWGGLGPKEITRLATGVELDDGPTAPARVEDVRIDGEKARFKLAIREGRKRQVRRMVQAVGGRVMGLTRISFAGVVLGTLPEGSYRELTRRERAELRRLVGLRPLQKKRPVREE